MSWWTEFRDGLETAAGLVANYFYPGTIALGHWVNSKGSQEQLFGTDWGQAASVISGLAGGYEGNMGNYGAAYDAMTGSTGIADPNLTQSAAGGFTSAGTNAAAEPAALASYQQMVNSGYPAQEAMIQSGLTQEQLANAGLSTGATDVGTDWGANNAQGSSSPYTQGTVDQTMSNLGTGTNAWGGAPVTGGFNAAGTSSAGSSLGGSLATGGTGGASAMPWGSTASNLNLASGVLGLLQSQRMNKAALAAQRAADPFGSQRDYYAEQLRALQGNPAMIEQLPGYQSGLRAVQRGMAAKGYIGSGNMAAALRNYGNDFYNQTMDRYASLAGAGFNPAAGAQLGLQGQQYGTELMGRSLGTLGYTAQMANTNPYQAPYNPYQGQQQYNPYSFMNPPRG